MAKDPIISCVVPCYNGAEHLPGCVRSIWEQKVHCEIIIVDDGSTDDTIGVAKSLMKEYPAHVFILTQGNQGAAAARNAGMRMARGKFICFLDADDRYAPEFFENAIKMLDNDPAATAVFCEMELINAHRPVEPWQKELMEASAPSNIVIRTETVRRIGGFPIHKAFRGRAAGEDYVFRFQLPVFGKVLKLNAPMLKYLVHKGSHFDYFLDRAILKDGKLDIKVLSQEEMDGTSDAAVKEFEESVRQRYVDRLDVEIRTAFTAVTDFIMLSPKLEKIEGFLHPLEGFALFWLARSWPQKGYVVEIGSFKGKSTCWMATGVKSGVQSRVVAVDHFHGSPEHQPGGTHPDTDVAGSGSTLEAFRRNVEAMGVADVVDVQIGSSVEVRAKWKHPIRLLFIDGDHSYEASAQDFMLWTPFVVPHGLVILHDIGTYPGVTALFNQVSRDTQHWRLVARVYTMGVFERLPQV